MRIQHALAARPSATENSEVDTPAEPFEAPAQTLFERIESLVAPRQPANKMVELSEVMSKEALAKVDPMVVRFYENPTGFDLRAGVDLGFLGKGLMPLIARVANEGHIPDTKRGFENYPMKQTLTKDTRGHVHWHRMVQVKGQWETLFDAKFERNGKFVTETFRRGPIEIPLTFAVTPYQGGIKLTLVPERSSPLAVGQKIVFTTVPSKDGLLTTGYLNTAILGPLGELSIRIKERA